MPLRFRQALLLLIALQAFVTPIQAEELSIAFWNVENLFDNFRDKRTEREDLFIPSELREKIRKDGEIIRQLNADIIGLMEVENRGVLNDLIDNELDGMGYKYNALLEVQNDRGIDVAIISRKPFLCYSFEVPDFYRGILAARFSVDGKPFYVIVNHWKSRFGGGEQERMNCSNKVIEIVNTLIPKFEGRSDVPVIIGGDLNDNDTDPSVINLENHGLINTLKTIPLKDRWTLPYDNRDKQLVELDTFDHLFITPSCQTSQYLKWQSSQVLRPEKMVSKRVIRGQEYLWPDEDHDDHIGYSDHFPVMGRFTIE